MTFYCTSKFSWFLSYSLSTSLDKNNYPLGLQIIGKPFDEQGILDIAYSMEEKINFKLKTNDWWIK